MYGRQFCAIDPSGRPQRGKSEEKAPGTARRFFLLCLSVCLPAKDLQIVFRRRNRSVEVGVRKSCFQGQPCTHAIVCFFRLFHLHLFLTQQSATWRFTPPFMTTLWLRLGAGVGPATVLAAGTVTDLASTAQTVATTIFAKAVCRSMQSRLRFHKQHSSFPWQLDPTVWITTTTLSRSVTGVVGPATVAAAPQAAIDSAAQMVVILICAAIALSPTSCPMERLWSHRKGAWKSVCGS